jgi:hypothetical protein
MQQVGAGLAAEIPDIEEPRASSNTTLTAIHTKLFHRLTNFIEFELPKLD